MVILSEKADPVLRTLFGMTVNNNNKVVVLNSSASLSSVYSEQSIRILELRTVLILQHVQRHLAALLHHAIAVLAVSLQDGQTRVLPDGSQRLGALVPHHGVLGLVLQSGAQVRDARLVLHLSQHVADLVTE